MNKKDAWSKGLPKAALALLAARKREYMKDRPKVFPSGRLSRESTAEYVRQFCLLNNLIP